MKHSDIPFLPSDAPLDPTLFAIDWTMVAEALMAIIILAFFVERALALLFESRWFLELEARRAHIHKKGIYKPFIAFAVSAAVCYVWQFDAISIIFHRASMTTLGMIITGAVIAGGSKASIKLFHDVLDVKSTTYDEIKKRGTKPSAAGLPGDPTVNPPGPPKS